MRLWCAVYHGDRFCSMLLGLPYVLNDNHYQSVIQAPGMAPGFYFVLRCAIISGKIIDRNMTAGNPSFARAMELDEEMESIASSQPVDWWAVPKTLDQPLEPLELNDLREQLLQQFYFYWVKLFLHLPFLVETTASSPHYFSRLACIEAAKQILKRYRLLRTKMKSGHCLFECKTTDFACFTAAVVLLIGTFHSSAACRSSNPVEEDLELVADTDRLLMSEEVENDCKVAAQCRKVLQMLSIREPDAADGDREVVIPYFGAVLRKRSHRTQPDPRHVAVPRSVEHASNDLGEVGDVPPPPPYNAAGQTAAVPAVENPWSLDGFSLEYISHRGFDRANLGGYQGADEVACTQDESASYMASAAMEWDPGWSVLTDINRDFMTGIEDLSAEDFEF